MARLNLRELQALSRLLLSDDENSVALGYEMILQHRQHIPQLRRELVLASVFSKEIPLRNNMAILLANHFSPDKVLQWQSVFEIFQVCQSHYRFRNGSLELLELVKRYENVRSDYEDLIKGNRFYLDEYHELANCIAAKLKRKWALAEELYLLLIEHNPQDSYIYYDLANLYEKKYGPNSQQELECYVNILKIDPTDFAAANNLGIIYYFQSKAREAIKYYKMAIACAKQTDNKTMAMSNLADAYYRLNNTEENQKIAKEIFLQALEIDPNNSYIYNQFGNYYWLGEKNYDQAKKIYEDGLEVAPKDAALMGNLAELQANIYKDYSQTIQLYSRSLNIEDSQYHLTHFITILALDMGKIELARNYYSKWYRCCITNKAARDSGLTEEAWQRFLEAEKKINPLKRPPKMYYSKTH